MRSNSLRALALTCVAVLLSAGSCADDVVRNSDDIARNSGILVRGQGDDVLSRGATRADELLSHVPPAVRPTVGTRLTDAARALSADPQVQSALEGMAWEAICSVASGDIPRSQESVANKLVDLGLAFGVQFLDDGEQVLAEAVLAAASEEENEVREACDQLADALSG